MKLRKIFMLLPFSFALVACSNEAIASDTTVNTQPEEIIPGEQMVINLLEFNDVHGHIEQNDGKYGISNAAYLVDKIRNEDSYDNTVLLSSGDMFQETAIARLSYGRVVVDVMSEMGFDMMSLGNHEFDWTLDKCLEYWDGNPDNGEANFPLINSNLYYDSGELVTIPGGNIVPSTIIEREGIKIGIIGLLGDVYNSILASMTEGYIMKGRDHEIAQIVLAEGGRLKEAGADIIVCSIHDGSPKGIEAYGANLELAKLRYKGEYLVDAVINGHTHSTVKGEILRPNGVAMPVIQSRAFDKSTGDMDCFGRIDLVVDLKTKDVVSSATSHVRVRTAGKNFNKDVQAIVDNYYNASKDVLEEVYCNNLTEMSRYSNATKWISNMMMAYTGANASVCNYQAVRGNIPVGPISFKEVYNFNPFDNCIVLMDIRGYDLKAFYDKNQKYEFVETEDGYIDQNKTYRLAIIDYVFFGKYFDKYRPKEYVVTTHTIRDLMINELRCYKTTGFDVDKDFNNMHN